MELSLYAHGLMIVKRGGNRNGRREQKLGNEIWVGNIKIDRKEDGVFRILFMNVRGVETEGMEMAYALKKFKEWGVDYLGIVDTKLGKSNILGLESAVTKLWSENELRPINCIVAGNKGVYGWVGGIASIIQNRYGRRVVKHIKDDRGWSRWSGFRIQGREKTSLTVLSVYGPTPTMNSVGSAWSHQYREIENCTLEGEEMQLDPRKQFLFDLNRTVAKVALDGDDVIIGGDFNVDAGCLEEWVEGLNLYDFVGEVTDYHPTYIRNKEVQTCIDHVYVSTGLVRNGLMKMGGLFLDGLWNSDHLPMVVDVDIERMLHIGPEDVRVNARRNPLFTTSSKLMIAKFQEQIANEWDRSSFSERIGECERIVECNGGDMRWHSPSSGPELEIQAIMSDVTQGVVQVAENVVSSFPSGKKFFNCWSPEAVKRAKASRKLQKIVRRWNNWWDWVHIRKYALKVIPTLEIDKQGLELPEVESDRNIGFWINGVKHKVKSLNKSLQGRYRREMRKRINVRVKLREQLREKKKIRKYLDKVLNRDPLQGPIGQVDVQGEDGEEVRVSRPKEVASVLVNHMAEWMGRGRDGWYMRGRARNLWDIETGRGARIKIAEGQINMDQYEIPQKFENILKHLQRKRKKDGTRIGPGDYEGCDRKIEDDEWLTYWKRKRKGSAPAESKFSVDMMKALPERISLDILRVVNMIWMKRLVIEQWTNELMLLVAKVPGNSSLHKIRPLRLLEIMRKAIFGITRKRVQKVWEDTQILNTNQYGFRGGRSTRHPLLNLCLVLEHARLKKKELHIVFQDIRRAFDSVEVSFGKEMALRRLGVPEYFIDMLIAYDLENKTQVITAYGRSSDLLGEEDGYFHAERGFGQGSEEGPMGWIAFYDIPLTMLDEVELPGYCFDNSIGQEEKVVGQSFAKSI